MIFCESGDGACASFDKYEKPLKVSYWILVAVVYFVLRIFNENTVSKTAAGVIYYAFTAALTCVCVKAVTDKRKQING